MVRWFILRHRHIGRFGRSVRDRRRHPRYLVTTKTRRSPTTAPGVAGPNLAPPASPTSPRSRLGSPGPKQPKTVGANLNSPNSNSAANHPGPVSRLRWAPRTPLKRRPSRRHGGHWWRGQRGSTRRGFGRRGGSADQRQHRPRPEPRACPDDAEQSQHRDPGRTPVAPAPVAWLHPRPRRAGRRATADPGGAACGHRAASGGPCTDRSRRRSIGACRPATLSAPNAQPPGDDAISARAIPESFRIGYADYLRVASTTDLLFAVLPGVADCLCFTAAGGVSASVSSVRPRPRRHRRSRASCRKHGVSWGLTGAPVRFEPHTVRVLNCSPPVGIRGRAHFLFVLWVTTIEDALRSLSGRSSRQNVSRRRLPLRSTGSPADPRSGGACSSPGGRGTDPVDPRRDVADEGYEVVARPATVEAVSWPKACARLR